MSYEFRATQTGTKSASVMVGDFGCESAPSYYKKLKYFEGMKMIDDMMKMNGDMKMMEGMDMNNTNNGYECVYPKLQAMVNQKAI